MVKRLSYCLLFLIAVLVFFGGYSAGQQEMSGPIDLDAAVMYNADSLACYAEMAYLHEDPEALFITAAASYLSTFDRQFPDSIHTVPRDEADIMLLRAAQLGNTHARRLIHCLAKDNMWHHSIPK